MGPPRGGWTAPTVLEVAPDFSKRLSDATLVEASVSARLLGMRLLTLDATIVLVPADATAATRPSEDGRAGFSVAARGSSPPLVNASAPAGRGGHRLADAVRNLEEGAKLLTESRRNAP